MSRGHQVLQEFQDNKALRGSEAKKVQCHGYLVFSLFVKTSLNNVKPVLNKDKQCLLPVGLSAGIFCF